MAHTLSADSSVGSTIEALEAELPELQKQQQALKDDLDAVTKRLEAVSTALSSLQLLSTGAVSAEVATAVAVAASVSEPATGDTAATIADVATEVTEEADAEAAATRKAAIGRQRTRGKAKSATGRATKTAAKKTAVAKKATKKAAAKAPKSAKAAVKATKAPKTVAKAAKAADKAKEAGTASERTSGLTDNVLAALRKAGRPMRASEVNDALGREETRTNVNSVRNTLERLRSTDRAQRSGRGLYEAAATS